MTIACCYVSPEGVVFGADSTASFGGGADGLHYYNHNQKIFEVGNDATLGIVTWGLGGLISLSYRTLIARLADRFAAQAPATVLDAMNSWIDDFWSEYSATLATPSVAPSVTLCRALDAKAPWTGNPNPPDGERTQQEDEQLQQIVMDMTVGFCLGGHMAPDRAPMAYYVHFTPLMTVKPTAIAVNSPGYQFWGAPNIMQRLLFAADDATRGAIASSPHWTGSVQDLDNILGNHSLGHPIIPLRDAIDFVYTCVYATIKALKFSHFPQICGGPIELAAITSDRRFRWVKHKALDAAVADGVAT